MRKIDLTDKELNEILIEFYKTFNNGYEFEQFLKVYLTEIGLDELEVTQKSNDGGVDLKAIKKGIDEFSELDSIKYYIQAKRYKPGSIVPIESVRALRGVLTEGLKGIFITTGKFTKKAYEFAREDPSRPLILIDGMQLLKNCIEKNIGFRNKPVFVKSDLRQLFSKEVKEINKKQEIFYSLFHDDYIKKFVTDSDIQKRILRFPNSIISRIPKNKITITVVFNNTIEKQLKIDKGRNYLSGITDIYKKFGLLDNDGQRFPKNSYWKLDEENMLLYINFD